MAGKVAAESGPTHIQSALRLAVHEWTTEAGPTSSFSGLTAHPAFRRIVELGRPAVPHLLREIESRPSLLVWALHEITGENPVPRSARGRIKDMAAAWISWGKERDLL